MGVPGKFGNLVKRLRLAGLLALSATLLSAFYWGLHHQSSSTDPLVFDYLEILGGVIALACAASALVRFRASRDRVSLLVALGFLLAGSIETGASLSFFTLSAVGVSAGSRVPLAWMLSQSLLAVLLAAALLVEKRLPFARKPSIEIAAALIVGAGLAYLATYFMVLAITWIRTSGPMPRPWQLVPATIFLLAAIGYARRFGRADSAFDHAICYAAGLNVICHLAASQSLSLFGPLFAFAEVAKVSSYAVVLGGSLVDSGRLLEQVQELAATDPLTRLGNYRRLLEVLDREIKRSQRTGRPFAVLLLDLDGLKSINDRYGHLVGSRALVRLANVLRASSRETDSPARYGGDEFALVLPENGEAPALQAAERICRRLAAEGKHPPLSASVGVAVYPRDGATIEKLLGAADRSLYAMKARSGIRLARVSGAGAILSSSD